MSKQEFETAFVQAQSEFEPIPKNKQGQVGNLKFKYAELPAILKATLPALHKYGFSLRQTFFYAQKVQFFQVKLCHKSGYCEVSNHRCDPPTGGDMQAYSKKVGYLRRVGTQNLLGVIGEDESNYANASSSETKFHAPTPRKKRKNTYDDVEDYRGGIGDLADIY